MPEQERVHIPNLTIQHFPRTAEGQALVNSHQVFCLDGSLYQGFKGTVADVAEKVLTDRELEAVHDVDGTKDRVWAERSARNKSRQFRKEEELSRRDEAKRDRELKDLELTKLRNELKIAPDPEPEETVSPRPALDKAPEIPDERQVAFMCDVCNKVPPEGHRNAKNWLRMHKFGAHSDHKRGRKKQ